MKNILDERNRLLCQRVKGYYAVGGGNEGNVTMDDAVDGALKSLAPRFFVSYDAAYRNVSLHLRGVVGKTTGRQKLYAEMARRVKTLMEQNPGMRYHVALNKVMDESAAPGLYLTPAYMKRLFYKLQKNNRLK